jgi:hypothetical protein
MPHFARQKIGNGPTLFLNPTNSNTLEEARPSAENSGLPFAGF